MTCKELAELLLHTPDSKVKVGVYVENTRVLNWHDVVGIAGTGRSGRRHQNDISITVGESDRQPESTT